MDFLKVILLSSCGLNSEVQIFLCSLHYSMQEITFFVF